MDVVLDNEESVQLEARGCAVQIEGVMDLAVEGLQQRHKNGVECHAQGGGEESKDRPLYCIEEGRNRSEVMPHFDYTGG